MIFRAAPLKRAPMRYPAPVWYPDTGHTVRAYRPHG